MTRLTKHQAVVLTAYTGILCGDVLAEHHDYIEQLLGRPILTHEIPSLRDEIRESARDDFLEIAAVT